MRREKIDIIYDMLVAIRNSNGKIKPTHLLYKSNLTHTKMKEYLKILIEKNHIIEIHEKNKKFYGINDDGLKFITEYEKMKEFATALGF